MNIKKLQWVELETFEQGYQCWVGETGLGSSYEISLCGVGSFPESSIVLAGENGNQNIIFTSGVCLSEEELKAEAQKDFEKIIKGWIE